MKISRAVVLRASGILKDKNITRYKLEKKTLIPHSTMETIFSEQNDGINIKTLFLIIKGLDMTISEFFNDKLFNLDELDLE